MDGIILLGNYFHQFFDFLKLSSTSLALISEFGLPDFKLVTELQEAFFFLVERFIGVFELLFVIGFMHLQQLNRFVLLPELRLLRLDVLVLRDYRVLKI